jgi:hypothetical protein
MKDFVTVLASLRFLTTTRGTLPTILFWLKFKCLVGEEEFKEIISYNEVMNHIEKDDTDGGPSRNTNEYRDTKDL